MVSPSYHVCLHLGFCLFVEVEPLWKHSEEATTCLNSHTVESLFILCKLFPDREGILQIPDISGHD